MAPTPFHGNKTSHLMNKTNKIHELNQWRGRGGAQRQLCVLARVWGEGGTVWREGIGTRNHGPQLFCSGDAKNKQHSVLALPLSLATSQVPGPPDSARWTLGNEAWGRGCSHVPAEASVAICSQQAWAPGWLSFDPLGMSSAGPSPHPHPQPPRWQEPTYQKQLTNL